MLVIINENKNPKGKCFGGRIAIWVIALLWAVVLQWL
jgi:hypothetical protein